MRAEDEENDNLAEIIYIRQHIPTVEIYSHAIQSKRDESGDARVEAYHSERADDDENCRDKASPCSKI